MSPALTDCPSADGNVGYNAGDLAADVDAKRGLDVSACHDALHEVGADDGVSGHDWAEQDLHPEIPQRDERREKRRSAEAPGP